MDKSTLRRTQEALQRKQMELIQQETAIQSCQAGLKKRELEIKLLKDQVLEKQNRAEAADAVHERERIRAAIVFDIKPKRATAAAAAAAVTFAGAAGAGVVAHVTTPQG